MVTELFLGFSYGFASGISPGPLLGLVLTQTLRHGRRAGVLVALAPLVTDLPIVLAAFLVVRGLPLWELGWLSISGGLFVVYLGAETLRSARSAQPVVARAGADPGLGSLWRGVGANLLNPNPYLFWATVGAPLLVSGYRAGGVPEAASFLFGFYVLLVGSKLALAFAVDKGRGQAGGKGLQGSARCERCAAYPARGSAGG
jgi:threonine/homoserine/homoserine lactone efflux protein